jgi:predicted ATPase
LIGREDAVRRILEITASSRLVTLTGTGGVGKTRLALQVAQELEPDFTDGVCFVDLSVLGNLALVEPTVAAALGVREPADLSLLAAMTGHLRPRHVLMVLDNCEHLLDPCAALAATLLRQCPDLHVLATSRQPLGVVGESVWRVPPLTAPGPGLIGQAPEVASSSWMEFAAVALFLERAAQSGADFPLTSANLRAVGRICHRVDGIPLAIELAAARVRALAVEEVAERLDDCFRLLQGNSRTTPPRQRTLSATIEWSYELLTPPERTLLRRLAAFVGGWTLEAAEQVCSGHASCVTRHVSEPSDTRPTTHDTRPEEVLDLLTSLVDRSLVIHEHGKVGGRYRLLETVRQYAEERLSAASEGERLRDRHCNWFLGLVERGNSRLHGPEQALWLERLETEHENLRAALEWALAKEPARALRLAGLLGGYWDARGYYTEGREALRQALERPSAADAPARVTALRWAAHLTFLQGDVAGAGRLLEEGIALGRACEDKESTVSSLAGLAAVAVKGGEYAAARDLYEESLAIGRTLGDSLGLTDPLVGLGDIAVCRGDYAPAGALYAEALAIYRAHEDASGIAASLYNLGRLAQFEGDYEGARSHFEESLAIRRELGEKGGMAGSLYALGLVNHLQGDRQTARALLEESLALHRELGNPEGMAASLTELGEAALGEGDLGRARSAFEESLAILRAAGYLSEIPGLQRSLGEVALLEGNTEAASSFLSESLAQSRALADPRNTALTLHSLGWLAQSRGYDARARALYAESLAIRNELGDRGGKTAACLEGLAQIALRSGCPARALQLLGAAEALRQASRAAALPAWQSTIDDAMAASRAALGEPRFEEAWAAGRALPAEQAIALALAEGGKAPALHERPLDPRMNTKGHEWE